MCQRQRTEGPDGPPGIGTPAPYGVIAAIGTLALGIGANTTIFSLVQTVLLRPLPYESPDRVVMVWEERTAAGFPRVTPAPGNYRDWRTMNRSFTDLSATAFAFANLTGDGAPEVVSADAPRAVVVNETLVRHFMPGQSALGRQIRFSPTAPLFTVVGVVKDVVERGYQQEAKPGVYATAAQGPRFFPTVTSSCAWTATRSVMRRPSSGSFVRSIPISQSV